MSCLGHLFTRGPLGRVCKSDQGAPLTRPGLLKFRTGGGFYNWEGAVVRESHLEKKKVLNISWPNCYRKVLRWEIFMEQELRFGLDLDQLAILKKKVSGPIMSNFWGCYFHVFRDKKMLNFFLTILVSALKKLHKWSLIENIFFLKELKNKL